MTRSHANQTANGMIHMKADSKPLEDGLKNAQKSVSDFLKSLPTAEEIREQIEKCDEEKKKLKKLLKVVEDG